MNVTKFIIVFLASMLFISVNVNSQDETGVYKYSDVATAVKGKAVDFTIDMNGKDLKFSELTKGKVVFLNFWGTWCPPCRKEIPYIIDIQKELRDKDFLVLGIATERGTLDQAVTKVEKYAKTNNINYINVVMDGKKQLLKQAYMKAADNPLQYVPTTIIIDKKGDIHHVIVGGRDKAGFMTAINDVLNK